MRSIRFAIALLPANHRLFPGQGVNLINGTAFHVPFDTLKMVAKCPEDLTMIEKQVYNEIDKYFKHIRKYCKSMGFEEKESPCP